VWRSLAATGSDEVHAPFGLGDQQFAERRQQQARGEVAARTDDSRETRAAVRQLLSSA
jgi:hypothetical protein